VSKIYKGIKIGGGDTGTPLNVAKRISYIRKFLVPSQSRVIDCGCGGGQYVLALNNYCSVEAIGIEYQLEKALNAQRVPELHGKIIHGDIEHIPYPDQFFNVALLNEVIEHIPDEKMALSEIHRILARDGLVIIFAPNRLYPFETHGVRLKKNGKKVPHWVPLIPYLPLSIGNKVFEYWARNYWQSEIINLTQSVGFIVVERAWMWQTFENISGKQPSFAGPIKPILRSISNLCQRLPVIKIFGVSQVIVARKV